MNKYVPSPFAMLAEKDDVFEGMDEIDEETGGVADLLPLSQVTCG